MVNNGNWLYENTPRMYYTAHGLKRKTSIKILSTYVHMLQRNSNTTERTVSFGQFFSAGCKPVITTGAIAPKAMRAHINLSGIGQEWPDHRGAVITAVASERTATFSSDFWVYLTCVGW